MKILFLAQHKWPHVGGVEKHIGEVSKWLRFSSAIKVKGGRVTIISSEDIKYPKIKYLGLLYIWYWLWKNRDIIKRSDLVHIHDVFIWYLPFRFIYPSKKVFTTFHGWEGIWPIPWKNILQKRIAAKLSAGTIAVGKYIEKYYGIKANHIVYGGTSIIRMAEVKKIRNSVVFLGRLEKDTGVLKFLKRLDDFKYRNVTFVGDGPLRKMCEKYGKVIGFTDPVPYLKKAEYCIPAGYLSYIEAKQFGCKILVFPNNPLKKDYWSEIEKNKTFPTWTDIANEYLTLYKIKT